MARGQRDGSELLGVEVASKGAAAAGTDESGNIRAL